MQNELTKLHATLSASASHRWTACPVSVELSQGVPDEASPYAAEGTKAHRFAELAMRNGFLSEEESVELEAFRANSPAEMCEAVKRYVSVVYDELKGNRAQCVLVEKRLPISGLTGEENAFGTADCVLITEEGDLWVVDLKYGMGVAVSADHNEQLIMYALAAYDELSFVYDIKTLNLCIVQPRLNSVSKWAFPANEWDTYRTLYRRSAQRALQILAKPECATEDDYHPSESVCKFCRGKLKCNAIAKFINEQTANAFEVLPPEDVKELEAAELKALPLPTNDIGLAKAFMFLPVLRSWADAVEAEATKRAQGGAELPGLKLVQGRAGNRKWIDEAEVEAVLRSMRLPKDVCYKLKVISPADVDKQFKQGRVGKRQYNRICKLITRAEPKPLLVPLSDKRQAIHVAATSFEVLSE